jgi:hypothetical protein
MKTAEVKKRRTGNHRWKGLYGVDRKFTARVDRMVQRGTTYPGKRLTPAPEGSSLVS